MSIPFPYSRCEQSTDDSFVLQSLKETFADKLPAEIEKVKKLRKYVILLTFFLTPCSTIAIKSILAIANAVVLPENMAPKLSEKSP
jgi:hypothetical protein